MMAQNRPIPPRVRGQRVSAGLGAVRFARHHHHFKEAVHFYRDLVGLPVYETFEGSYGSNGVIFGMPGASLTFELVETDEPVTVDRHEQICLYLMPARRKGQPPGSGRPGMEPVDSHPYWVATGAVTYPDPDGRNSCSRHLSTATTNPAPVSPRGSMITRPPPKAASSKSPGEQRPGNQSSGGE